MLSKPEIGFGSPRLGNYPEANPESPKTHNQMNAAQVGCNFEGPGKGIIVAALKSIGYFFPFQCSMKYGVRQGPSGKR